MTDAQWNEAVEQTAAARLRAEIVERFRHEVRELRLALADGEPNVGMALTRIREIERYVEKLARESCPPSLTEGHRQPETLSLAGPAD